MAIEGSPIITSAILDHDLQLERSTKSLLKQNGWNFLQDGRYIQASPLSIVDHVKTKITFGLSQLVYTAGEGLQLNYNQPDNRFYPTEVNATYVVSFRFKVVPASQSGFLDVSVECPGASFNPIIQDTCTFAKTAGTEHFFSITHPLFISQDLVTNGVELFIHPNGTNISVYDYSVFVQKTYIP